MNEATQQGASAEEHSQQVAPPEPDTNEAPVNPRDAILNNIDEQIDQQRHQEQRAFIEENAEELGMAPPPPEPGPEADGAQAVQAMHPPAEPVNPLPENLQSHEMADYIVMHDGEPHMKAKVHGVDKLIPMARVQQQAQKLEAADVSLQTASQMTKDLNQREEWIRQNEAALQNRLAEMNTAPPVGVPEEDLVGEAKEIVSTLFQGDEDTAATKLAHLLSRSQAPANAAPAIDTTQIANQAAAVAVSQMTERDRNQDALKGLEQFKTEYPEIMADLNLYNMADNMTDVIENEHPDWLPSQLMLEAGRRTRDWLAKQKGETLPGELPQPSITNDPTRQERKDNLVRIPNPALGAVSPHGEYEEPVQTPNDALHEIRESRGQPV